MLNFSVFECSLSNYWKLFKSQWFNNDNPLWFNGHFEITASFKKRLHFPSVPFHFALKSLSFTFPLLTKCYKNISGQIDGAKRAQQRIFKKNYKISENWKKPSLRSTLFFLSILFFSVLLYFSYIFLILTFSYKKQSLYYSLPYSIYIGY